MNRKRLLIVALAVIAIVGIAFIVENMIVQNATNSTKILFLTDINKANNVTNIVVKANTSFTRNLNSSIITYPASVTLFKQGKNTKITTTALGDISTTYLLGNTSIYCIYNTTQKQNTCLNWSYELFNLYENSLFPFTVNNILFQLNGNGRDFVPYNQTLYSYFLDNLKHGTRAGSCDYFTFNFTQSSEPLNISVCINNQTGFIEEYKNSFVDEYPVVSSSESTNSLNNSYFSFPVDFLVQNATCSRSNITAYFSPLVNMSGAYLAAHVQNSNYTNSLVEGGANVGALEQGHNYTAIINLTSPLNLSYYLQFSPNARIPVQFYLANEPNTTMQFSCYIVK